MNPHQELLLTDPGEIPSEWTDWLSEDFEPSKQTAIWIEAAQKRDKWVGELLRERLCSHPYWSYKGDPAKEEAYWTSLAGNCPTLDGGKVLLERERRASEAPKSLKTR